MAERTAQGEMIHSGLTDHKIADATQEICYRESITGQITSPQYSSDFKCIGDTITILRDPVGSNSVYCADGAPLEYMSMPEITGTTWRPNRERAANVSISSLKRAEICRLDGLIKKYLANNLKSIDLSIEREALAIMAAGAGAYNKGLHAGREERVFNMGAGGQQVQFNSASSLNILAQVDAVARQNCAMGEVFVVLPLQAKPIILANHILANACTSGSAVSSMISGQIPPLFFNNMRILFSPNLRRHTEANGQLAYSCVFGSSQATAYFYKITKNRILEDVDHTSFNDYWNLLVTYGIKVIDERLLGNLYASFTLS